MRHLAGRVVAVAVLALALGDFPAAAQTVEDFFNDNILHEVRIRIRASDWQALRDKFLDNTYYPCDLTWQFEGRNITVRNIGIRSRGRGSRSPIKPAFRADFNRYDETQQFLGLKSVILRNMTQDASMLKERLSMLFFQRMGLPASREAHTRLYVNDQYAGVYLIQESVDRRFLKLRFGEDEGYLYKFNPLTEGYRFEYKGSDPKFYTPEPWTPETHENDPEPRPLVDMIRTVNQASDGDFVRAVSEYMDLRLFVIHVAIETYLAEFDGILGDVFGMNNFYHYRFKGRNLFQLVVWDKDGTFTWDERPIFFNANDNVLMRRAVAIPEFRQLYLQTLVRAAATAGGPGGWLEQEINRQYNQIRQAALEDPNKEYSDSGVLRLCSNECFEAEVARIITFVRRRGDFVIREAIAAGYQPSEGGPRLNDGGAVNAAPGGASLLAPGSLVSVFGERLSNSTEQATTLPLPTTLGGVSVLVNGIPAPLLFVSPGQVNLQIPWEITTNAVSLVASVGGVAGNAISANIGPYSPGVFAVVHNADGSLVTPDKPVVAGEFLLIFANGLGPVDPPENGATGRPAPASPLASTREAPVVTIGGARGEVLFSGLTPGFVGLYQINLRVPTGIPAGSGTPLVVSVGGQTTAPLALATR